MKLFFDFFPIIIFFIIFKFYGIYAATASFIIVSFLQILVHWVLYRRVEKMHLITFALGLLLGGATLIFHNEMFIKWKPTAIYWIFALVFLITQFIGPKTILERMMENNIALQKSIWTKLNYSWAVFFFLMGLLNLYVVYHYDTNTWVNFKLFGIVGLTLLFLVLQGLYLGRHVKHDDQKTSP